MKYKIFKTPHCNGIEASNVVAARNNAMKFAESVDCVSISEYCQNVKSPNPWAVANWNSTWAAWYFVVYYND
jgi:hypothetical protein